jgi:hypothetical protein
VDSSLTLKITSIQKPPPRKHEVLLIKKRPGIWDDYVQEASDIYGSKALTKKGYKANQKKFYSLPEEQQRKIWKIKSRRELQGKK